MHNYQHAKTAIKEAAQTAKRQKPTDKPYQRQVINDTADALCKEFNLPEHYRNWLSLYACKLHP